MLNGTSFANYIISCCNRDKQLRLGQHMFNELCQHNPKLAESIRGELTTIDPFYRDDNILAFLEYVINNWSRYE